MDWLSAPGHNEHTSSHASCAWPQPTSHPHASCAWPQPTSHLHAPRGLSLMLIFLSHCCHNPSGYYIYTLHTSSTSSSSVPLKLWMLHLYFGYYIYTTQTTFYYFCPGGGIISVPHPERGVPFAAHILSRFTEATSKEKDHFSAFSVSLSLSFSEAS